MPYIKPERRKAFDADIDSLGDQITNAGELNYVITRLCHRSIDRAGGMSYTAGNAVMGVLESAKAEFYRRWLAPYEDEKIKENGDVPD